MVPLETTVSVKGVTEGGRRCTLQVPPAQPCGFSPESAVAQAGGKGDTERLATD